jgi:hypothetical protein
MTVWQLCQTADEIKEPKASEITISSVAARRKLKPTSFARGLGFQVLSLAFLAPDVISVGFICNLLYFDP